MSLLPPQKPGGSQGLSVSTWEKIKVQLWEVSSALGKRLEGRDEAAAADKASEQFPTLGGSRAVGGTGVRDLLGGQRGVRGGRLGGRAVLALAAFFSFDLLLCVRPAGSTVCGREICGRAEPGAALGRVGTRREGRGGGRNR